jgi:hypothetical protein
MWQGLWTLIRPTTPGEFWTMAYAVVTVALLIAAVLGLRSLSLAKSDILTRSKREARQCAITRCEQMAQKIIDRNGNLLGRLATASRPVFVKSASDVVFDPDTAEHLAGARVWVQGLSQDLHQDCISHLNQLEAWAMYFTHGVADHAIAFGPCAPVYCSMIVQYYAVLLVRRAGHSSGKFPNAVQLFKSWSEALEREKSGVKMEELVRQLSELQARRRPEAPLPHPLGTQLD